MPEYLTPQDAARMLGVSTRTLRRWRRACPELDRAGQHNLGGVRVLRWRRETLEDLLRTRTLPDNSGQ